MPTLLLRLQGPMQSWGTTSRFDERDTQLEPSKSGVLGLIAAAMGRDRSESVADLASLRMGVRVEREGKVMRDYQTATGVAIASSGKPDLGRTVVSPRYFLSDAVFLVGLEGDDALLRQIDRALRQPVWPLALGRKSFVPSEPVALDPPGLSAGPLEPSLDSWPCLLSGQKCESKRRAVLEDNAEGAIRLDQPTAPFALRQFGPRYVKSVLLGMGDAYAFDSP